MTAYLCVHGDYIHQRFFQVVSDTCNQTGKGKAFSEATSRTFQEAEGPAAAQSS